jgi:ABC-type multidrug transport system ATPase subunit
LTCLGAGKTTLLNALSGRLAGGRGKKIAGSLLVNGELVSFAQMKKLGSYVMQDDVLLNELTPKYVIKCEYSWI